MDMFDNVWGDKSKVVVDNCVDITRPVCFLCFRLLPVFQCVHQIALFVIGVAGSLYSILTDSLITADSRVWASGLMDK